MQSRIRRWLELAVLAGLLATAAVLLSVALLFVAAPVHLSLT